MTDTQTQTVRRLADVPRDKALAALVAKFPDHDVISFVNETVQRTAAGKTEDALYYVATIVKRAELPGAAPEPGLAPQEAAPEPEPEIDFEEDGPEGEGKDETEEPDSEKLDKILDLLTELTGDTAGMGAPMDEVGPLPETIPGNEGLPAPVKPQNELGGGHPAFARKASYTVEAHSPGQSLSSAVNEINAQVGPYGYRVAKINRKGPKIIAYIKHSLGDRRPLHETGIPPQGVGMGTPDTRSLEMQSEIRMLREQIANMQQLMDGKTPYSEPVG